MFVLNRMAGKTNLHPILVIAVFFYKKRPVTLTAKAGSIRPARQREENYSVQSKRLPLMPFIAHPRSGLRQTILFGG